MSSFLELMRRRDTKPTSNIPDYLLICHGARGSNTNHVFDEYWVLVDGYPEVTCRRCGTVLLARYHAGRVIPRYHTWIIEEHP